MGNRIYDQDDKITKNFVDEIRVGQTIKLEMKNGYYYKGSIKEINEDFMMLEDVRGRLCELKFDEVSWIRIMPIGDDAMFRERNKIYLDDVKARGKDVFRMSHK